MGSKNNPWLAGFPVTSPTHETAQVVNFLTENLVYQPFVLMRAGRHGTGNALLPRL